ncbi:RNA polymerase rpb1 [Hirsutella rhossiliensis]|uniref:DNA-directed RNA polymerase subunit n=1 Tax=Hirsutella rhossiliensis TaxID=111463 RepID=A0A9P8NBX5_9HYPO|nr:RNA polymerase rpb1 [Hirsutella rhossiliensis]KAH0968337.1 RNA polymerase rpb1 [Hirsutella rhossiliensis]
MNIAQPVSSEVESVGFTLLTADEIRAISVKRIENESTFDNLLNPVPGGLYDPALGSWGDSPCTTCNLNQASCPGHSGHIQLPVPVYHPVFLDQAYRLLRAACVYCHGFRLPPKELHKFSCKLRLLQHGLIQQAHMVGSIAENELALDLQGDLGLSDSEAEEDGASGEAIMRTREKYVQQCLRGSKLRRGDVKKGKHEGATELRRDVIKEFLAEITKSRLCSSCGGISPSYRKDRVVKIFEKSLSDKDKAKMAQKILTWDDAMTRVYQETQARKHDGHTSDEGVADVCSPGRGDAGHEPAAPLEGIVLPEANSSEAVPSQRYISSMEVKARLTELFTKEQEFLSLLYNSKPPTRSSQKVTPDMFFLSTVLVPPNRFRPEARTGDSQIAEAQQNALYKSILRSCGRIARIYGALESGEADLTQMHRAWTELQEAVNALIDKTKNPVQGAAAKRNEDGIKQLLEKKEGLFRKNMMGKRVNFAARSVISPDPNIETNEIGVPPVFAKKLTYPEPVTSHNFKDMQQAVINGVDKWPGAFAVENENGQVISLRNKSADDRISLANQLLAPTNTNAARIRNKKVYRHLTNGDIVLMNRQPTLHKPSIMGHRVRVLPGEKTLRMHYANCNTYNADFDGDEMNMHFPQNEVARAEALQIADTDHQYLSSTAGKPLRGLIQDHISVSVVLCNRDTFFNRGDYHQLIYSALRPESGHILGERLRLVPPAIIRPEPKWTGKQVLTTILKNICPPNCGGLTMREDAQIKADQWGINSEEGTVLIQDGEFITGILDKSQIGPSSGGLIHAIHEIYGSALAGKLLSSLGRLLTRYLNMRAFSCGMDDLGLTPEGESARRKELLSADQRLEEVARDDSKQEGLDLLMNNGTRDITDANQMQAMTTSGAKGSKFLYGEDGLEVTKQKYLSDFKFILQNVTSEAAQLRYDPKVGENLGANRATFAKYMKSAVKHAKVRDPNAKDPLIASVNPATHAFATSEAFYDAMTSYLKGNGDGLVRDKGDKAAQGLSRVTLNRKNAEMLFAMKYLKSLVEPGEAVGIVAGQSVGEPSTQMTLNTFHLAGHSAKNVTLGIPRLREILMTASKDISTPSMTLYPIKELSSEEAEVFAKSISVLRLEYILDKVDVEERVGRGKVNEMAKIYNVRFEFFPSEEYTKTYAIGVSDVMDTVERKLLRTILSLMKKEVKKGRAQATLATPVIGVKAGVVEMAAPQADDDARGGNDDDDDDEGGDDDATATKQRANRTEAVSYGPNDEEDDAVQRENERDAMASDMEDEGIGGSRPPVAQGSADDSDADDDDEGMGDGSSWSAKARAERIINAYAEVTDFESDERDGGWCNVTLEFDFFIPKVLMLNIVHEAVRKTVVQQIAGVKSCSLVDEQKSGCMVLTEGVNLQAMQKYNDFIDPNRIQTNDIGAVLAVYGVEACRGNIVLELAGVFASHGIKVDNRHLNLIADYMTRNGGFTAFSRMGLKGNVSPFTKMSFETTLAFLKDAVLDGDWDDLTTPSSRLVMGRLGRVGTGGFDVLTQLPTYQTGSLA